MSTIHRPLLNYLEIRSQATSDYNPSFVTEALREMEYSDTPSQEIDLLKDVAVQVYIGWSMCSTYSFLAHGNNISGGVDTTASTIGTFFLAMVCYPEVQKKAQAELDEVLDGRLPEHSDIASLPYFSALIKELYRFVAIFFFSRMSI